MMNKNILLFIAFPGSGKTTLIKKIMQSNSFIQGLFIGEELRFKALTDIKLQQSLKKGLAQLENETMIRDIIIQKIQSFQESNDDFLIFDGWPKTSEQLSFLFNIIIKQYDFNVSLLVGEIDQQIANSRALSQNRLSQRLDYNLDIQNARCEEFNNTLILLQNKLQTFKIQLEHSEVSFNSLSKIINFLKNND